MTALVSLPPLSLYIHIPWCVQKCPYCDFNSHGIKARTITAQGYSPEQENIPEQEYVQALIADFNQDYQAYAGQRKLETIFIGGGTPSILAPAAIGAILGAVEPEMKARYERNEPLVSPQALYDYLNHVHASNPAKNALNGSFDASLTLSLTPLPSFKIAPAEPLGGPEVTMEANPGTVDTFKFAQFVAQGVNRISIGIQSFHAHHLKKLGRIHDLAQAITAVVAARTSGAKRVNIDLMYGLPEQKIHEALQDLLLAIRLRPSHISWYQLTIEPNTQFGSRPPKLPEDDYIFQIELLGKLVLAAAGYKQYEVSAYAYAGDQEVTEQDYAELVLGLAQLNNQALDSLEFIARFACGEGELARFNFPTEILLAYRRQQVLAGGLKNASLADKSAAENAADANIQASTAYAQANATYEAALAELIVHYGEAAANSAATDLPDSDVFLANRCQHNMAYWSYADYLGIGTGAAGKVNAQVLRAQNQPASQDQSQLASLPEDLHGIRLTKIKHPQGYLKRYAQAKLPSQAGLIKIRNLDPEATVDANEVDSTFKLPSQPCAFLDRHELVHTDDLLFEYFMNRLRLFNKVSKQDFTQATGLDASVADVAFKQFYLEGYFNLEPDASANTSANTLANTSASVGVDSEIIKVDAKTTQADPDRLEAEADLAQADAIAEQADNAYARGCALDYWLLSQKGRLYLNDILEDLI